MRKEDFSSPLFPLRSASLTLKNRPMAAVAADPADVKFGILGCAGIARKLVRAMRATDGVRPFAVGSRDLEKARKFQEETQMGEGSRVYGSYQEVLDDADVDAVYIPLPTGLHLEWVLKSAARGKHVLVEKPPARTVAELDQMLDACARANVQFMDGTMWMHNPRAAAMAAALRDGATFGEVRRVNASFFFCGGPDFFANDIRLQPHLDSLGCLGDLGWYCIRAALWAFGGGVPKKVAGHPDPVRAERGGNLVSCGATLTWRGGRQVASFDCGFDGAFRQTLAVGGARAHLALDDFVIPHRERACGFQVAVDNGGLVDMATRTAVDVETRRVELAAPQEALMVAEFARLARQLAGGGAAPPEPRWPALARDTMRVLCAVLESLDNGGKEVIL